MEVQVKGLFKPTTKGEKLRFSFFVSLVFVLVVNLFGVLLVHVVNPTISLPILFYSIFFSAEILMCFGFFYVARIWTFSVAGLQEELAVLAKNKS